MDWLLYGGTSISTLILPFLQLSMTKADGELFIKEVTENFKKGKSILEDRFILSAAKTGVLMFQGVSGKPLPYRLKFPNAETV